MASKKYTRTELNMHILRLYFHSWWATELDGHRVSFDKPY